MSQIDFFSLLVANYQPEATLSKLNLTGCYYHGNLKDILKVVWNTEHILIPPQRKQFWTFQLKKLLFS